MIHHAHRVKRTGCEAPCEPSMHIAFGGNVYGANFRDSAALNRADLLRIHYQYPCNLRALLIPARLDYLALVYWMIASWNFVGADWIFFKKVSKISAMQSDWVFLCETKHCCYFLSKTAATFSWKREMTVSTAVRFKEEPYTDLRTVPNVFF